MKRIEYPENQLLQGNGQLWNLILRPILYGVVGAILYYVFSRLFAFFQPSIGIITFRPATVIVVLFGALYGPWAGLLSGALGKTLVDVLSGWGFYWYGSVAYSLIGFVPGLMSIIVKDFRPSRNVSKAVLWAALGVLVSALFLFVVELFLSDLNLKVALLSDLQPTLAGNLPSDINLKVAFLDLFWPEFAGNLIVVIVFLPLLLIAINSLDRSK